MSFLIVYTPPTTGILRQNSKPDYITDATDNGFTLSAGGTTVLGFSFTGSVVPAGCGTLVVLDLDGNATGLSEIIMAGSDGGALDFVDRQLDRGSRIEGTDYDHSLVCDHRTFQS